MKKFFRKKLIRQNWCSFALYKTKKKYYSFITAYPIGPSQRGIRLISLSHNPVFSSGALPPGAPFLPGKSKKSQKQRQMTNLIVDNVILWFIMSKYEQSMIEVRTSSVFPIRAQEGRGRKGQPPKGIRVPAPGTPGTTENIRRTVTRGVPHRSGELSGRCFGCVMNSVCSVHDFFILEEQLCTVPSGHWCPRCSP